MVLFFRYTGETNHHYSVEQNLASIEEIIVFLKNYLERGSKMISLQIEEPDYDSQSGVGSMFYQDKVMSKSNYLQLFDDLPWHDSL